jgi:hypothetical protein
MKLLYALVPTFFLIPSTSIARDVYCSGPSLTIYQGGNYEIDFQVTTSKARKIQNIGQAAPTKGCYRDFRPPGVIISREIIKKPTLGRAKTLNLYRLYYEADKAGKDELIYKATWEHGGRVGSATIKMKISVFDEPIK